MSKSFDIAVDIHASSERVWAVLLDVERWPEWTASTTRIERLDHGPFAVGSRARVVQPKLRPAVWEVAELDEGTRTFTWVSRAPGVQITGRHRVEENRGGSRLLLTLEYSGVLAPLVAWLYGKLTEQYVAMEANGLRARCEG